MSKQAFAAALRFGLAAWMTMSWFGNVAATPVADPPDTLTAPGADGEDSPYLAGDALSLLPDGQAGGVDVIAVGPPFGWVVPVVVRNATTEPVVLANVSGTAHDANGEQLATGESGSSLGPSVVPPGQAAIALVYFNSLEETPADAVLAFDLNAEPEATARNFRQDLEVEVTSVDEQGIAGAVSNASERPLVGRVGVVGICFDAGGGIVGVYDTYADENDLAPGASATFTAPLYGAGPCAAYLIAASGYVKA